MGDIRTGAVKTLEDPPALAPPEGAFKDRRQAGENLAQLLERFREEHPVVVGMPRGGVPVAAEVALALDAPLDVAVVRKIGAPQNPEYAIGAVAEGGVHVLSSRAARALGLSDAHVQTLVARVADELAERGRRYRGGREPAVLSGRTVILVDDGLATGRSAHAAIRSVRGRGAARVILAVPVGAPDSVQALLGAVDEIVCAKTPEDLWAVGLWYEDFAPTSDEEVVMLMAQAAERCWPVEGDAALPSAGERAREPSELMIDVGLDVPLLGDLDIPVGARAIVAFAHGSGSSRLSPRNREVARALADAGYATLLFDLLTASEELDRANVFDIELLASRLVVASAWIARREECAGLALAYFGASTGAAAALTAAAELGDRVCAVISRGGRPDLAQKLGQVRAPTLLIVGGADTQVLELNREAQRRLHCPSELAIVPDATHLFEEPGALEQVSRLAVGWLDRHVVRA